VTKAKVLYYGHDLEYLREAKRAEIENDDELRRHAETLKVSEQQTMDRMDVVLTCSHSEAATIRELCPSVHVECIPPYAVSVDRTAVFSKKERSGLLFVGGFSHKPNVDAVNTFMRDVWPAIQRAIPGVIFSIAGSNPPPEVLALAGDNVRVLGFVSDAELHELYRTARLTVVPLRYGAGVKGKTVEAMAYGVPVVGTALAFEGMEDIAFYLHPLQQTEPMHRAVIDLYDNDAALKSISARQREFVQGRFSLDAIAAAFNRAIGGQERQENSA
jgi:glycosyltransferase involved in cell wall biosynthesis